MDFLGVVEELIGKLGFPIAICIILLIQNTKLHQLLENNTLAIKELTLKLDKEK